VVKYKPFGIAMPCGLTKAVVCSMQYFTAVLCVCCTHLGISGCVCPGNDKLVCQEMIQELDIARYCLGFILAKHVFLVTDVCVLITV